MKKVSVIVPVYNVLKYIDKCLDSLVNQTLDDYEIIVVNDGSPYGEQEIIDQYIKKYPNLIKSYTKTNGGQADARNYALQHSTGEYIMFVDSDDYISKTCLEEMYTKAKEHNFDIVVCDLEFIYEDDKKNKVVSSGIDEDLFGTEGIKHLMIYVYIAMCNKLYKKTLFEENKFKTGVLYEDVELQYRIFPSAKAIGTIKKPLYKYLQRTSTNTMSQFDTRVYHYVDNMNDIVDYYKKNNFYEKYYEELEYVYARYVCIVFLKTATMLSFKEYNKAINVAKRNIKEKFPKYRFNKYIKKPKLKHFLLFFFNKPLFWIGFLFKKRINKR